MGYDPHDCYTGRSPLEAVSIGIELADTDVTLRCNLVTLSDEPNYADKKMLDYSAGEISTAEAGELIDYLKKHFDDDEFTLYRGVSYRHCLVVKNGKVGHELTPPHDITGKPIKDCLPKGPLGEKYLAMMEKSAKLLAEHPVNKARVAAARTPPTPCGSGEKGRSPRSKILRRSSAKRAA